MGSLQKPLPSLFQKLAIIPAFGFQDCTKNANLSCQRTANSKPVVLPEGHGFSHFLEDLLQTTQPRGVGMEVWELCQNLWGCADVIGNSPGDSNYSSPPALSLINSLALR